MFLIGYVMIFLNKLILKGMELQVGGRIDVK